MAEVKNCTAEKKYDSIVIGAERKAKLEPHLRSIDLKFTFKNSAEPISVSFYDSDANSMRCQNWKQKQIHGQQYFLK